MKKFLTSILLAALTAVSWAAPTDLSYPPTSSAGHDLNQGPIGQTFTATASDVHAGIYLADENSFTSWLASIYPGQIAPGSYPYAVAPSVTVQIVLMEGEGTTGNWLASTSWTLTAPFSGFLDVDYGGIGTMLTVGQKYTIVMSDISGQTYPQGVTGWVVPSAIDFTSPTLSGAYADGLPILQGTFVANDAGIGDNCFEVIDNTPGVQTVSGTNAVITAYVARNPGFIVINGGLNLLDHLWTSNLNPGNTTFLDGLVNWFQTGLLVDYTGIVTPQGVILTQLTVKRVPAAPVVSGASLPDGTVGVAYSGPIAITGGLAPFNSTVSGLPAGLSFDGNNVIGTPTASGVVTLNITVTDALGRTASASPTLTINPAPVNNNYTIRDEGQGRISAIGADYLLVGSKKLVWNSSTFINVNEVPNSSRTVIGSYVKVGMRVQWKGLRDPATSTVLMSRVEIN